MNQIDCVFDELFTELLIEKLEEKVISYTAPKKVDSNRISIHAFEVQLQVFFKSTAVNININSLFKVDERREWLPNTPKSNAHVTNARPYTVYPNPPSQLSLWEETGVPGENPRLSAER